MRHLNILVLSLIMLTGSTAILCPASKANPRFHHRINHRQFKQGFRIDQGITNGSLTNKEAFRLERAQQRLAAQEQRLRSSGNGLNCRERARLKHEQNRLSWNIYNQKHN